MDCTRQRGFLFWKKSCGRPSIGPCDACRRFVCQMHGGIQGDGGLMCNACLNKDDDDSGSWWSSDDSSSSSSSGSWSGDSSSSSSDSSSSSSSDSSSSSSSD